MKGNEEDDLRWSSCRKPMAGEGDEWFAFEPYGEDIGTSGLLSTTKLPFAIIPGRIG